jgi:hypothetical protein
VSSCSDISTDQMNSFHLISLLWIKGQCCCAGKKKMHT